MLGLEVLYTTFRFAVLGIKPRASCKLGKRFINRYMEVPLACSPMAFSYYLARPTHIPSMDAPLMD